MSRIGGSATDYVTDLTDRRKFGNGLCNGFNGLMLMFEGKMKKCALPITDYRLPITDYRLPITDYQGLPIMVKAAQ